MLAVFTGTFPPLTAKLKKASDLTFEEANADNYDKAWVDSEKLLAIIAQYKAFIKPGEANHFLAR